LFGTSRQISTGPSSALAAVAGSAVVTAEVAPEAAPALVAAVTLVAGLLFGGGFWVLVVAGGIHRRLTTLQIRRLESAHAQ
jgi:hypothetical protein